MRIWTETYNVGYKKDSLQTFPNLHQTMLKRPVKNYRNLRDRARFYLASDIALTMDGW